VAPGVGDVAPDFTLPGTGGRDYTLSQYRGGNVVLAFYPGDFTPGCTRQLCSYRDDFSVFADAGATVLGISPQSVESHERFAAKHGFEFPLLADAEKRVIGEYGVGAPLIGVRRSIFVVDAEGVIRSKHVGIVGVTYVKAAEIGRVLDEIGSQA